MARPEPPPIEASLTKPATLRDHLLWQMQMSDFVDIELSTVGLASITSAHLALYGRSYSVGSSGSFNWQTFAGTVARILAKTGMEAQRLQLEVTETVFLGRGAEYVHRTLDTLSEAGIRIALDDFGTGYASLTHLKQFPVDVVKIDRSFLRDIHDPHNAAIIRTVVSLGRSLGLEVVAEGVETAEQEAYLIAEGCPLAQGYLYGKGVPAGRVPALVRGGRARQPIAA